MLIPLGILAASGASRLGVAAYFAGVANFSGVNVNKLSFPSETISLLSVGLSTPVERNASFSNSSVAGYFAGGSSSGNLRSQVDKFAFPADTRTTLSAGLSPARDRASGMSNYDVAGYVAGGRVPGRTDTVQRFSFPTDTRSNTTTLSILSESNSGMANNSVAGYIAGGEFFNLNVSQVQLTATVDKFAFPAETRSTLGTGLSIARNLAAGMANVAVAGYIMGGGGNSNGRVDKFAFPTDARSILSVGLSGNISSLAGAGNSGVAGYRAGGTDLNASVQTDILDRFAFPSDTRSTLGAKLTSVARNFAGLSDEGAF